VNILAVETSCDETAAAVVTDGTMIRSSVISSQIELHRPYGGVVPELASRHHLELIQPVIQQALDQAQVPIDAIAATYGPGLASSLLIGLNAGKGMSLALGKPFIGINHVEAHLYSPLLANNSWDAIPMIALIVSGGHTILAHVTSVGRHEILGQTLDDAAGEAFDKVAKLLGLRYPGGPEVERAAVAGNPTAIAFPRSLLHEDHFNFSFSGLKTAVLYHVRKHPQHSVPDICASFQEAAVEVLVSKTIRAALETGARNVSASGGVAINGRFRASLDAACRRQGLRLLLAPATLCTDNAAMIAALAYYKLRDGAASDWSLDVAPSIGLGVAA
jgi:N6-L-threonylcarbamoyladenine synthase